MKWRSALRYQEICKEILVAGMLPLYAPILVWSDKSGC
jgi:hypothetical protein